MDQVDRWRDTANGFDARVASIAASQWSSPTPCSEWNVEELVNHVAATQVLFGSILGLPDVPPKWTDVNTAMSSLLTSAGVLDGTALVGQLGERPKTAILEICINDMLIHTWDLSRAPSEQTRPSPTTPWTPATSGCSLCQTKSFALRTAMATPRW